MSLNKKKMLDSPPTFYEMIEGKDYFFYKVDEKECDEVFYKDLYAGCYGFVTKEDWDFLWKLDSVNWKFGLGIPHKYIRTIDYWKKVLKPIKQRT